MPLERVIDERDILAKWIEDGQYAITQRLDGRDALLRRGPFAIEDAKAHAIALAEHCGASAWIEDLPGFATLLWQHAETCGGG